MEIPRRDWLTVPEVAAQFGVTPAGVRVWIQTGQLEADQTATGAGTWLVHECAVEQFKKNRESCVTFPFTRRKTTKTGIVHNKLYRVKSTGEVITGAELLRRRGNPQ